MKKFINMGDLSFCTYFGQWKLFFFFKKKGPVLYLLYYCTIVAIARFLSVCWYCKMFQGHLAYFLLQCCNEPFFRGHLFLFFFLPQSVYAFMLVCVYIRAFVY